VEPAVKDPKRVRAGQASARARWGEPRILRLDQLSPTKQALIRALIALDEDAARSGNEKAASIVDTLAAGPEGHANDQPAA
jgi:hypothetical protein